MSSLFGADLSPGISLQKRSELRHLVMAGEMDKVLEILQSDFPESLEDEANGVNFAVQCQRFLELVRREQLEEAVAFAQEHLGKLQRGSPAQDMALQKVVLALWFTHAILATRHQLFYVQVGHLHGLQMCGLRKAGGRAPGLILGLCGFTENSAGFSSLVKPHEQESKALIAWKNSRAC